MGYLTPQFPKDTTSENYWRAIYAGSFSQRDWWVCLGRKDKGWADDDNPPDATAGDSIIEVLGYKKIDYKTLVVPDPDPSTGTLVWRNMRYRPIDLADTWRKHRGMYPRWLFLRATITTTELPTEQYFRQVGLYTDLVPVGGYSGYEYLLAGQVDDPGNLLYIENISQMWRLENEIEDISFVLEF